MADFRNLEFTLTVCAALVLCGCARDRAPAGTRGWPAVLRYGVSIAQENPETEGSRLKPIGKYLESRLHIPVEITASSGYGVMIEALRAKKIEACSLGRLLTSSLRREWARK